MYSKSNLQVLNFFGWKVWWLVSVSQETQNLSYIKSVAYFLSIYALSDKLE